MSIILIGAATDTYGSIPIAALLATIGIAELILMMMRDVTLS